MSMAACIHSLEGNAKNSIEELEQAMSNLYKTAASRRQYDGDLAVATLALSFLLTATQIGFVADGLMMVSGQGWFLSLLFAIVIATGLLHSQFLMNRLFEKALPRRYAWLFGGLTAVITGLMSVWGMTRLSEAWTYKWAMGIFLGTLVPLQTTLLANMTTGMFALAGRNWYKGSLCEKFFAVVSTSRAEVAQAAEARPAQAPEETLGASSVDTAAASLAPPPIAAPEPVPSPAPLQASPREERLAEEPQPTLSSAPPSQDQSRYHERSHNSPILNSESRIASFSFSEERVSIRIKSHLSKRQWKDLHSRLRRVASITWDDVEKTTSQDGQRERILTGRVSYPDSRGKKNRKKREAARLRHLDELLRQLKELVAIYN